VRYETLVKHLKQNENGCEEVKELDKLNLNFMSSKPVRPMPLKAAAINKMNTSGDEF